MVLHEIAPSLQAWLTAWLDAAPAGSTPQEALLHSSMIEAARTARAHIATMTPEQRAKMGLPEHGWEQIVWGGIGLEPGPGLSDDRAPGVAAGGPVAVPE